jgi:hypothetical protein
MQPGPCEGPCERFQRFVDAQVSGRYGVVVVVQEGSPQLPIGHTYPTLMVE